MCVREIDPKETTRTLAFELWMKAPNPMVTFFKTYDVMPLIKVSKSRGMKFNMLPYLFSVPYARGYHRPGHVLHKCPFA